MKKKTKKKTIIKFLLCVGVIVIIICLFLSSRNRETKSNKSNIANNIKTNIENNNNNDNTERENIQIRNMKVIINETSYNVELEENEATRRLTNILPQEYTMNDLNENEKYIYLDMDLPVNQYSPKHIEKGDIMLYGSNCLVIFYKSFDTPFNYTKIGHINDLPDLGDGSITIKLENI